jgi:hydrogenase-4 component F
MVEIVFLLPFLTGAACLFSAGKNRRPAGVTGALHLVILRDGLGRPGPGFSGYFAVTPEGLLSLLVISLLFFLISIYTTPI